MNSTTASTQPAVEVSSWNACYNSDDGIVSLSCAIKARTSEISAIGLMLNDSSGETLASSYVEFSDDCQSATPGINVSPGALKVGDRIHGVVSGQAGGQHFFFQEALTIGNC